MINMIGMMILTFLIFKLMSLLSNPVSKVLFVLANKKTAVSNQTR
jgi:hypothetical protein